MRMIVLSLVKLSKIFILKHVYAVCCHPEVSDEMVFKYTGKYILCKAVADRQQVCKQRDINCARYGYNAGQILGEGSYPEPEYDE